MFASFAKRYLSLALLVAASTTNAIATPSEEVASDASTPVQATVHDIIINEIQVANIDQFIDPSFNYGGWIELYNPTDTVLYISRMYISDDPAVPTKYRFASTMGSIKPHGYRAIWFDHYAKSGDTRYSTNAYKQVDFTLNVEGGTIYLYDSSGNLVASQTYPPAYSRASYARTTDGGPIWAYTSTPTPEASNDGSSFAEVQLSSPDVSHNGTVYTNPIYLRVTIPNGATLRYTTDGTVPTLTNGMVSENGRFTVSGKTIVYRFRLFRDGYIPSPVVTRSFLYKDREYYLPIVAITTDPKNLYDSRIGVYVDGSNGTSGNNKSNSNKNRAWERPVNFEYFTPDNDGQYLCQLNQETDFEVCGGWSRHFFTHASFRVKAAKQYEGNNYLPYSFFPNDKPYIRHKAVQLRNGGNDYNSRIIDAAIHQCVLTSGFYVDCLAKQPTHVFFNGVHQLMFNMRETSNRNLSYSNYGIDKDSVDQFEINTVVGYEQKAGDKTVFQRWLSLARELSASPTNNDIYDQICQIVDIDEYCNYMAAECYIGCTDWLTNCNNVKGFRARRDDGKFHLVMMDLDSGFGTNNIISQLSGRLSDSRFDTGRNYLIDIFLCMIKHEGFKRRFIDAFCLVAGSVFEPERCAAIIRQMASESETALSYEGRSPWGSANSLINTISSSSNRASRISGVRSYFRLPQGYNIKLNADTDHASLFVNGQKVPTGYFDGTLFAPVTLSAQPPAGYRFTGWSTDALTDQHTLIALDSPWYFHDQGSLDGRAWTSNNYSTSTWSTGNAPFGYGTVGINAGAGDYSTVLDYGSSASEKRPTYYFRRNVTLSKAPTADDVFQFTYYVDDGCVIYVNGTELERYHMPEGTPTYNTYSTTYEGNQAYSATITIPNSLLRAGRNTIAVEVHNCSASSSDIFWAATLVQSSNRPFATSEDVSLEQLGGPGTYTLTAHFLPLADSQLADSLTTPIRVNEVSAGNDIFVGDYFKRNDWFELYNTTDTPLDAAGLYVSDNIGKPYKFQIVASPTVPTVIPPHGYLVVWADHLQSLTQVHADFKLSNNARQVVTVTSSDDFVAANADFFAQHPTLANFTDALSYDAHLGHQSIGRFPDGANALHLMNRPSIGTANSLLTFDRFLGYDIGYERLLDGISDLAEEPAPPADADDPAAVPVAYYDLSGQLVATDARALRPGIYVVRLSNGRSRKMLLGK